MIAGLALVLAASGTAYAVTATQVNITDPDTPSRAAAVDSSGRLSTAIPYASLSSTTVSFVDDVGVPILGPTNARLAVTALNYDNSFNRIYANTDYVVTLDRITVGPSGSCTGSDRSTDRYRQDALPQGQTVNTSFATPLLFKPVGTGKYCIGVSIFSTDSTHPTPYYATTLTIAAYVASGSYTGPGTHASAAPSAPLQPQLKTD